MRNMYHIPSLEYFTIVKLEDALKKQLEATRRLQQELQQLQDETCLEVDEMQEIIDNQQEHIKQMTAQLHNTLERKLQMSFELSAAQQEVAEWKHIHSDACEMNRRLCLDLEKAEGEAHELGRQLHNAWANNRKQDQWLEEAKQEAAAARAAADNATQDAINCRRANDSLLDQLQSAEAKLAYIRMNHFGIYSCMIEDMYQVAPPGQSAPTPQQGETVPPRPMWSRYRSE
jgi:hypothetical protein